MSQSAESSAPDIATPEIDGLDTKASFFTSDGPEPHRGRTREILAAHPEIRELVGRNPWTLAIISGVVGTHLVAAWLLQSAEWWVVLLAAYFFGAFLTHALWAMIHECTHQRLVRSPAGNKLAGILANLVMVVPTSTSFEKYHLKHHRYQGIHQHDADLPGDWEVKWFAGSVLGRMAWVSIYPILLIFRPSRMDETQLWDKWLTLNTAAVIVADALILVLLGPMALLYLALSMLFALGLHPLGARWIQEHFTANPTQETFSYYGPLNSIQLNIGYHNEHHDFPGVPWNKLRDVKRIGGEAYDSLISHQSWSKLLFNFVIKGNPDITGRVVRSGRNVNKGGAVTAEEVAAL